MNDQIDAPTYIGQEVKAIMQVIAGIDPYMPDEDLVEVLIGAVAAWGGVEAQVLFPALETALEGSEAATAPARERLHTLYSLQVIIHEEVEAQEPYASVAKRYVDGVKYHLLADVQELVPLAAQIPRNLSISLAQKMQALKLELE
jgi:hypothetical protein